MCSFCVRLCGWTRSLCLSALPSYRAPDEVIRTVTGVARLHCLYLAGVSVVRCQIVITLVVFLLSVSVFQVLRLFSPGRVSVFPWRVRTGLYSLPYTLFDSYVVNKICTYFLWFLVSPAFLNTETQTFLYKKLSFVLSVFLLCASFCVNPPGTTGIASWMTDVLSRAVQIWRMLSYLNLFPQPISPWAALLRCEATEHLKRKNVEITTASHHFVLITM